MAKVTKLGQYGTHAEIKAAASLCQKPIYVATDSLNVNKCMWTVFQPAQLNKTDVRKKNFISHPRLGTRLPTLKGVTMTEFAPPYGHTTKSPSINKRHFMSLQYRI